MVSISHLKRAFRAVISGVLILAVFFSGLLPVLAQSVDAEPPTLQYDPVDRGVLGKEQTFAISATDNVELESVTFSYRFAEEADYERQPMLRQGNSDMFSITLPADALGSKTDVIQYYIEAIDLEGNRTLEGFAFNPITRILVDASQVGPAQTQAQSGVISEFNNLSTGKKILYGALGVLAVGVLVAASDRGGTEVAPGVDVTVVVDQLPIDN